MFVWTPWAVPGLAAMLVCLLLGLVVFATAPGRTTNRRLALVIGADGLNVGAGTALTFLNDDYAWAYAWLAMAWIARVAMPALYLSFLATLDSPLTRPLRRRAAMASIWLATAAAELVLVARTDLLIPELVPTRFAPWQQGSGDATFQALGIVVALVLLFGLLVTLTMWRAASTPTARRRAGSYALAFGVRDALLFVFLAGLLTFAAADGPFWWWRRVGAAVITLAYVPLVAYGILQSQLFDIDLRIKWTVRQGTLAAAFLAVFFVAAQLGQNFLSAQYGWAVGGVAAGLLLFAIAPLQRAAERVANASVPGADGSAAYVLFRKMEVYREAVEGLLVDGVLSTKERRTLDRLRVKLGISGQAANELERDVRRSPLRAMP